MLYSFSMFDSESSELDSSKTQLPRETELKDQNDELMKENTVLRSQFEDAIKITKQLEELHSQNNELLATVRKLRAEKDDLAHRLEISLQSNQEMSAKLNDEKRSCSTIRGTDLNSMTKEIEKIKQQSKAQLDSIYDQLEKAKQSTERESLEKRLLASKLDHILEDSQRYFQINFKTIDDFASFLSTPPVVQDALAGKLTAGPGLPGGLSLSQPAPGPSQNQQNVIDQLDHKLKKLKAKLKAASSSASQLEEKLNKNQQEFNSERSQLKSQIKNLERSVQEAESQRKNVENQYSYQVNALQQKNATLTKKVDSLNEQVKSQQSELKDTHKENANLHKELTEANLKLQFIKDKQALNDPVVPTPTPVSIPSSITTQIVGEGESAEALLHQQNDELREQVNNLTRSQDGLRDKLRESESKINNLLITIEKSKADYEALQHLHESDTLEIESLRNALHTIEEAGKEIHNKNKNAPRQPSNRILKLQKALDSEKQKVYLLQNTESKLNTRIEDLEAELRLSGQTVQDAELEAERCRNELNSLRRQQECQHPPTADDLLPPSVFRCEEFDPALSSAIVRIANNAALQPVSKLQNCFKAIRKHYDKQITARDEALDQAFTENQTLSNSFNQFLVDASIALNDKAVTLQDFFGNNAGHHLVDEIAQLRVDQANLRHQYDTLRGFIGTFQNSLGSYCTENNDIVQQMNEIRNVLETQKEAINARSKKIHELKAIVRSTNAALKTKETEYENSLRELEETNNELQNNLRHLQGENKNLHDQNDQLTNELNTVTQEREQLESTIIQEQDDQTQTLIENFHKQEEQYKEELKSKNEQIRQLRTSAANYEAEIQKQRQLLVGLKSSKQKLEQENSELQRSLKEHEDNANKRLEEEKKNITNTFENAVNELKEQCEKHRQDVQKMASQVSETELKNSQIQQEINQVRKEKRKMETEVSSMKNTLERERKLMESTVRAQKVQSEASYNTRLEEQRNKFESEKRRLFAMGTEAFRNFFNPSEQIDERSFRCVLDKARDTITKLNNSDLSIRRMLCAGEHQTTQDAVAQLLMSKGCSA